MDEPVYVTLRSSSYTARGNYVYSKQPHRDGMVGPYTVDTKSESYETLPDQTKCYVYRKR